MPRMKRGRRFGRKWVSEFRVNETEAETVQSSLWNGIGKGNDKATCQ
jgi:hypothetical protein